MMTRPSRQEGLPEASRRAGRRDRDAVALALEGLRGRIVRGEIPPGAELSQVELARLVGVSTTPLREALRQLEAEGLVQSQRNRRPRIPPFDPNDLDTVYSNRVLLESLAVALTVPDMTDDDLASLQRDLSEMRSAAKPSRLERWEVAHSSFHIALIAGSNPSLREQIATLMARSDRYRRMSILRSEPLGWSIGESEHEAIVEACASGDAAAASLLLAQHLARSALVVVAHMAPEVDLAGVRTALQIVTAGANGVGASRRRRGERTRRPRHDDRDALTLRPTGL